MKAARHDTARLMGVRVLNRISGSRLSAGPAARQLGSSQVHN